MSQDHDQSYYEIALTNKQVMSIFVVLLVSILAAFLGGVWLGRDADGGLEMASAQSITGGVGTGEAPLEQLEFFARDDQAPGQPDAADDSAKPAGAAGPASPPAKTSELPDRKPSTNPQEAPAVAGQAPPSALERALPTEDPEPAVVAEQRPPVRDGTPSSQQDLVVIQVFSSTEEGQARRVFNRLRKGGYPAVISPVEVGGRTLHRVRLGPYTDRDEAQVVAESVRRTYKLDTWITH